MREALACHIILEFLIYQDYMIKTENIFDFYFDKSGINQPEADEPQAQWIINPCVGSSQPGADKSVRG